MASVTKLVADRALRLAGRASRIDAGRTAG